MESGQEQGGDPLLPRCWPAHSCPASSPPFLHQPQTPSHQSTGATRPFWAASCHPHGTCHAPLSVNSGRSSVPFLLPECLSLPGNASSREAQLRLSQPPRFRANRLLSGALACSSHRPARAGVCTLLWAPRGEPGSGGWPNGESAPARGAAGGMRGPPRSPSPGCYHRRRRGSRWTWAGIAFIYAGHKWCDFASREPRELRRGPQSRVPRPPGACPGIPRVPSSLPAARGPGRQVLSAEWVSGAGTRLVWNLPGSSRNHLVLFLGSRRFRTGPSGACVGHSEGHAFS